MMMTVRTDGHDDERRENDDAADVDRVLLVYQPPLDLTPAPLSRRGWRTSRSQDSEPLTK